nr:transposase [Bosea lathyri]
MPYRWFCRPELEGNVPDHSTFSKIRCARFRESAGFRALLETTVLRRLTEGLLVSLKNTAANEHRSAAGSEAGDSGDRARPRRPVRVFLHAPDEVAWRSASEGKPTFVSGSNPAAQSTISLKGDIFFTFSANCLIDLDHAVIGAVEAPRAIRRRDGRSIQMMFARAPGYFGHCRPGSAAGNIYFSGESFAWPAHDRGSMYSGLQQIGIPRRPLKPRRLLL